MRRHFCLLLLSFLFIHSSFAQTTRLRVLLDSLRIAGNIPGLSMAYVNKDNASIAIVSGYNDKEKKTFLTTSDRMLQGSVGKTYASAIALQLVKKGKIQLDEKVSEYLGQYEWYHRIPNAATITVRMLMNHTSGVMRYEFKDRFLKDLTANPVKAWKPEELLSYVLDEIPLFNAGEGWDYSDTNYILLGMIIEKITGEKYYDLLKKDILQPFKLVNTFPSDNRNLKGLTQGYAGETNEFGRRDKVIGDDGLFIINPQFEWTGGGVYSTTGDLAKWGKLLYEGKVVDTALLFSSAVSAKLGKDTKYALGVIIRPTPLGIAYGHSGFFPGYMTELLYFPEHRISIAIQCNSSDLKNLRISLLKCLLEIVKEVKTP
ncbi:MAG: serine hydrolase domain-containing protein [Chitinophagaceae bacterium]